MTPKRARLQQAPERPKEIKLKSLSHIDLVVMDWGIGGLSVFNEIRKQSSELSILYFSDAGTTPYGKLTPRQLRERLKNVILNFHEEGVSQFVIACNAASTALPGLLQYFKNREIRISGVIEPAISLVQKTISKSVGVIGGRRTIRSRIYQRKLKTTKRQVVGRAAQPLSAMIEKGELKSLAMNLALDEILHPLKKCDSLLLACTHYPAVKKQIQARLPNCKLLDPALETARWVHKNWVKKPMKPKSENRSYSNTTVRSAKRLKSQFIFVTTGNPRQMKTSARLAFGNQLTKVQKIKTTSVPKLK